MQLLDVSKRAFIAKIAVATFPEIAYRAMPVIASTFWLVAWARTRITNRIRLKALFIVVLYFYGLTFMITYST